MKNYKYLDEVIGYWMNKEELVRKLEDIDHYKILFPTTTTTISKTTSKTTTRKQWEDFLLVWNIYGREIKYMEGETWVMKILFLKMQQLRD